MKVVRRLVLYCCLILLSTSWGGAATPDPSLEEGARVFRERCSLCHGPLGRGRGWLARVLQDYPATDLLKPRFGSDDDSLRWIIIWGGSRGEMDRFSPPWGSELTWTEIESVLLFVRYLREETGSAGKLLQQQAPTAQPSLQAGASIFRGRCAACHGRSGKGDGAMAGIVGSPAPFNLTRSRAPDGYLARIIGHGGAALQRSPMMPPWVEELNASEIGSLILFLKALRR